MKRVALGVVLLTMVNLPTAMAAVTYDEHGVGFVGKGDIQSIYDWNNSDLQQNATQLSFQFIGAGKVTWLCEWWTGPDNNRKYHTVSESADAVSATVAMDPRKNKQGQITGFQLLGTEDSDSDSLAVGECGGEGAGKQLVEGSIQYEGSEEPMLQVKFADGDWYDLPLTL
ncbi:hypothetical protein [Shewanella sp. FJAT-52076]|uniref:hypothetical protein n=1 Tax=Shewanella sp. FJAT-52076 TaxID=2864202 RepID=UPI001C65AC37|nr:hypothetical protein [Shewanella sp. FJAT-52076]QYJ74982.1 hypothetical protein K0H79_16820 [Shewanella sp. FJAT-52076]